jgi:general secretion pathway protein A
MYTHFFSLKQPPFSIAPDPRYLFMSERHREALAHLVYGIGSGGGFVLLTGEIGAGKTTVCRCFIEQIPDNCRLAYIFNPKLSVEELLLSICDEFRIELPPVGAGAVSIKSYVDAINNYLLASHAQGSNNVLVIDEAQNLSADVLEQLRLLTNLETSERKLLQIILIGQPELRTILARPELEQLAQRVIARYHLGSLSEGETASYIAHRLAVAGASAITPFPRPLIGLVHRLTDGVPRRINLLCDRALLGAYVENRAEVTRVILRKAAEEVFVGQHAPSSRRNRVARLAGGVLASAAIGAAAGWLVVLPLLKPAVPAATANAIAPPTSQAPANPAILATPAATPVYASAADALRELAQLWDAKLTPGDPCQAALKMNLRCYQGRGGLYELRLLDRPAVLTLHDGPNLVYAVLAGLDDNTARLRVNGKSVTLGVAALAARFDGEYTTFWIAPRAFREQVPPGQKGPDVDWVATRLAYINGAPPPSPDRPLDSKMQRLLREFQARQNLKADGVTGPRTYMRLSQLGGVAEPRLLATKGQGK